MTPKRIAAKELERIIRKTSAMLSPGFSQPVPGPLASQLASTGGSAIVASAINDAAGIPQFPAAPPHVVGVAALDREGNAAPFTNFGPWVQACALGVELVSAFFNEALVHPEQAGSDIDNFEGVAVWTGTSFATPIVVAALARKMATGGTSRDAVEALIDLPGLERRQQLGVVIQ